MSTVSFERQGAIALVTLDRPHRLNAISTELTADLHRALASAERDPEVRVIVLAGNGRAFCAGDDLKEFDLQTRDQDAIEAHIRGIQRITRDLMFSSRVVVGALHGYAVGGGFEWLLNCDLVVAADDLVAFFPEMDWGQFVTGGVTHLLPQAIGHQQAMELLVLGERQSAAALHARGLVNRVVPAGQVRETALELAQAVAAKSPTSVAALKRTLTRGLDGRLDRALELEEEITIATFATPDAADRVRGFTER